MAELTKDCFFDSPTIVFQGRAVKRIYGRDKLVKDVAAAGAADTLTVINYIAGIADNLTCTGLNTFETWDKRFDASERAEGVSL